MALNINAESYNCVDLFCGAGGFSLAAQNAGFTVRLAVENNVHAVTTYRNNFSRSSSPPIVIDGDIRAINPEEAFQNIFSDGERCDLLLGGPPCQGFSTHRINGAGIGDERNNLIHTYFSFVHAFSPSVFLMENVPGMLWPRHADYLRHFYEEGYKAGYAIEPPVILDARDFGVPQRRKRVFILGIKNGIDASHFIWPPPPTHGSPAACGTNPNLIPWQSCNHIFGPAKSNDPNDIHMNHNAELVAAFRNTPPNGGSRRDSGRILACHANHDGHKDVYGRIDPSQPAPTMTTACINPSKGRFVHPTLHHGITARQAARIQTFPDNFIFHGGLTAAGMQIGNAVPVKMGEFLLKYIKILIEEGRNSDSNLNTARYEKA